MDKTILVWRFEDAPKEYHLFWLRVKGLNLNLHVQSMTPCHFGLWMGGPFGCSSVLRIEVKEGVIFIGCHG